jgi:hypothetical protein
MLAAVARSPMRIMLVFCLTWVALSVFAILGMQLMAGTLGSCSDVAVDFRGECVGTDPAHSAEEGVSVPRAWSVAALNFDWIGAAFVSVLSAATHDDLPGLFFSAADGTDRDRGPRVNGREWIAVYFVPLVVACALFFINLFVGVMADAYQDAARDHEARRAQAGAAGRRRRALTRDDLPIVVDEEEEDAAARVTLRSMRRNFRCREDGLEVVEGMRHGP